MRSADPFNPDPFDIEVGDTVHVDPMASTGNAGTVFEVTEIDGYTFCGQSAETDAGMMFGRSRIVLHEHGPNQ